jgi:hydroxymethylpyrimidine/phosphomethylpyrimidine kinase
MRDQEKAHLSMAHPKALTIAGSDSGGGAGIQADLKTFAAFGVYGCSVITAVTAQNTQGVSAIKAISPSMVRKQLESVLSDIRPDVLKTGMLANADVVQVVAAVLRAAPRIPLVLDPVMLSKSGDALLAPDAVAVLKELLLPLADLVTPNVPEAEALTGTRLNSDEDFEAAARHLYAMGARAVLLKGGHRPRFQADSDSTPGEVIDLLYDGQEFRLIRDRWVNTPHTHGIGCTLASAIAAGLAHGMELYPAVLQARAYLTRAMEAAFAIGQGIGPVHHFHAWWAPND